MISVEALTKTFADAEAVSGISFRVETGEVLGFLGPNGAGKTTTMRMLTCFVPPTSGTANVGGFDIHDHPVEVRRRIGYMPENVPMYGEMRVDEYLRFRARLKGVPRSRVASRLDDVAARCGIGEVRRRVIDRLSKGYRQRVGLAEALLHEPPILILDEPTVGLDPNQIRQVRELIRDLGKEHTILLSSHILPEVEQVCGRVVIISRGRIVAQDRPDALRLAMGGASRLDVEIRGDRAAVLAALERISDVTAVREADLDRAAPAAPPLDGVVRAIVESGTGGDLREEVFRLVVERGWVLLGLAQGRLSLEDIFIDLTTRDPGAEDAGHTPMAGEGADSGGSATESGGWVAADGSTANGSSTPGEALR